MSWSLPRLSAETPNAIIGSVSLGHFISHFYFLAFPPLFPLLFSEFDVTYAELGLLVSSLYGMMFVFQIPFGWIVDQGYAKHVLVGGLLLTAGGILGASTATTYPVLLGFALLSGIGQATYHPADYALLDTVSTEARSGRSFGVHTFAGYAGSGVAPIVIGGLGLRYGWRPALLIASTVGIVYALIIGVSIEPVYDNALQSTRTSERDTTDSSLAKEIFQPFFHPLLVAMFVFFIAIVVAESGIQSFTIVFLVESLGLNEATGNAALTSFFLLASIGVLIGGYLADRYSSATIAIIFLILTTCVAFVLTFELLPVTVTTSLILFAAIGFGYGAVMPARDRLVAEFSPEQSVGKSFGVVFTGAAIGGSVGPVLIGRAIDIAGSSISMFLVGLFFLIGAAIVVSIQLARTHGRAISVAFGGGT
ncbi:MFS transporter [Halopenitus sp. H-Gu1]|uniref:MFS transporter n=1 Tax=Halopenitus sp. H-Gu1 TaxID=3242697 RepID=UPI00359D3B97